MIKAITSTYHLMMKFSTSIEVGEVRGDRKIARQCFITAIKTNSPSKPKAKLQLQMDDAEMDALRDDEEITHVDPRETENTKSLEEVTTISIHPDYPDCHVMIGTELTKELQNALVEFSKNYDVFAWSQGAR